MGPKLKTADLFSGIGGIRAGFEKAGFETVVAIDHDKYCKVTYDLNFGEPKMLIDNINEINPESLPDFDILLAGFPCQPFSIAGQKEGFKDKERGNAFFKIMEMVDCKKPQAIFLENVKNLLTHDGKRTYSVIKDELEKRGYYVKEKVLNSLEYGNVPKNRERIYIVAFKSMVAFEAFSFPGKVPLTKQAVDVLDEQVDEKYYYRQGWLYDRIFDKMDDDTYVYQWRRVYLRKNGKQGVCFTLTANMGMGGHNVPLVRDKNGLRRLTPKECSRFQGFTESFQIPKNISDVQLYKQFGNSVTVSVVARIASNIKRAVEKAERAKNTKSETKIRPAFLI